MKLIIEENQLRRVIKTIAEVKKSRSLAMARKSGIGAIFPKMAIKSNSLRFRPYEKTKMGIEEIDMHIDEIASA